MENTHAAIRKREQRLRKRFKQVSGHFFGNVLAEMYRAVGEDISFESVLTWLSFDDFARIVQREPRELFLECSQLDFLELNRIGPKPLIRIKAAR